MPSAQDPDHLGHCVATVVGSTTEVPAESGPETGRFWEKCGKTLRKFWENVRKCRENLGQCRKQSENCGKF